MTYTKIIYWDDIDLIRYETGTHLPNNLSYFDRDRHVEQFLTLHIGYLPDNWEYA